jgi:hypothetical protein
MYRREFIKKLASGIAVGWAFGRWPGAFPPLGEFAATPNLIIACLADPHLRDGKDKRPEALSLARAVAEIRFLKPAPNLVLFAGDLAHDGNPGALALGEEILSELPMPVLAVRGGGDGRPQKGEAGWGLFNNGRFVHGFEGINLLGLDTVWQDTLEGPAFALGETQYRWLDRVLSGLDPARPLVILSHAPLTPIFRPWGQWTVDSGPLLSRLSRFINVLCLHGHVHLCGLLAEGCLDVESFGHYRELKTENREPISHLALPATSWPLPLTLEGTPRKLRPGLGPHGCGWVLLNPRGQSHRFQQVVWQA